MNTSQRRLRREMARLLTSQTPGYPTLADFGFTQRAAFRPRLDDRSLPSKTKGPSRMKPAPRSHRNSPIKYIYLATDLELIDSLDDLVRDAAAGHYDSIGAIAVAFAPILLEVARAELGPMFEQDAGDVLHRFHWALLQRELTFPLIRGSAIPWMKRMVRSFAKDHLKSRGPGWKEAG
jgi:hypothetical protein